MKKTLIIAGLLFSATGVLKAQHVNFGVKSGLNISKVDITDGRDYNTKAGAHVGALAHIHITRQFALQPEIVYSTQGGEDGNSTLKLNYINMPVLGQFMFGNGFRLQTGPQLGVLTVAKNKVGGLEVDVKGDVEDIDLSWVLGASYIFPVGIGLDARFNAGLNNISNDRDFRAYNRVFQLGVFYQFTHGPSARRR